MSKPHWEGRDRLSSRGWGKKKTPVCKRWASLQQEEKNSMKGKEGGVARRMSGSTKGTKRAGSRAAKKGAGAIVKNMSLHIYVSNESGANRRPRGIRTQVP